jgi:hypothetical protein
VYRSKYSIHASGSSTAVPLNGLGAETESEIAVPGAGCLSVRSRSSAKNYVDQNLAFRCGVFRILKRGANHGERESASLYGDLGALPPAGSRGRAPGQGALTP